MICEIKKSATLYTGAFLTVAVNHHGEAILHTVVSDEPLPRTTHYALRAYSFLRLLTGLSSAALIV